MPSKGGSTPARQLTYRQRSALLLGWAYVAVAALMAVGLARSWSRDPNPAFLAWLVVGLGVSWALFLRPYVRVDADGVTLANVLRDVFVPWPIVEDVRTRWNLEVLTPQRGYTSWAISTQVNRPKGGLTSGLLGLAGGRRGAVDVGAPAAGSAGVTAQAVAQVIEETRDDYAGAVAEGRLQPPAEPAVAVRWRPLELAALLVPLAVAVYLVLR